MSVNTFTSTRRSAVSLGLIMLVGALPSVVLAQAVPEPPRRPDSVGAAPSGPTRLPGSQSNPVPAQATPAGPASGQQTAGALSEDAAVDRVNAYLNSFRSLIADFSQLGADGRRYAGKLYVQRPGRMRFEYNPPATIEIVADGTTVVVRDKRLATQDPYLIAQTPLKFLLKEQIDLRKDVKITRVQSTPDTIRITLEDRATLGGTSRITLTYDPRTNTLRQWLIVDPQGHETNVQLANLDTTRRPDPALFHINLERVLEPPRN